MKKKRNCEYMNNMRWISHEAKAENDLNVQVRIRGGGGGGGGGEGANWSTPRWPPSVAPYISCFLPPPPPTILDPLLEVTSLSDLVLYSRVVKGP